MNINDIEKIILANPHLSYEEILNEAQRVGIPTELVKQAYIQIKQPVIQAKPRFFVRSSKKFLIILLVYAITGLEISILLILSKEPILPYSLVKIIDETSQFAVMILIFHLSTKLLGFGEHIYKSALLSGLFFVIGKLAEAMSDSFAYLYVGIIFLILTFYIIMKSYDIGILKAFLLLIVNGIANTLVILIARLLLTIQRNIFFT